VSGSFILLGSRLDLDVQLSDLTTGAQLARFGLQTAPDSSLLTAVDDLGVRLTAAVSALPPMAPAEALDSLREFRSQLGLRDGVPKR
jgi:hypothetical protein